jgi:hypothetical protein
MNLQPATLYPIPYTLYPTRQESEQ